MTRYTSPFDTLRHTKPRPCPRIPLFHFLLLGLFLCNLCVAEDDLTSGHRMRQFQTLSDDLVRALAELDPPESTSVTEGHLGKILIPRAGMSTLSTLRSYGLAED